MKTFNIVYTIKGPAGVVRAPNKPNPVEAESLAAVLSTLKDSPLLTPNYERKSTFLVEIIGVSIEEIEIVKADPNAI